MGDLFDHARVVVLLADYIGIDAGGKVNAIGAGFTLTQLQPTGLSPSEGAAGVTGAMHLIALIDVPSKYAGHEFAVSLELRDDSADTAVKLPSPTGVPEPLRIQQMVKAERPSLPGAYLPSDVPCRVQLSLGFPNGLPLTQGGFYSWRLQIDGRDRKDWRAAFHVLGPPPPPVFGGPSGPANIPDLAPPPSVESED
jgi:hypothetical protein